MIPQVEKVDLKIDDKKIQKKRPWACKARQIFAGLLMNCLQISQGLSIPLSSIMIPQLVEGSNSSFTLTINEASWFASIYCIGSLSGALLGGFQGEYFGRRKSLIIDTLTFTFGLIMIGASNSFYMLLIGRLAIGHAAASGSVVIPAYASEISEPSIRGVIGTFMLLLYFFGYATSTICGSLMPWRYTVGVALTPGFFAFFGLLFLAPESPVWLIKNGMDRLAFETLKKLRENDYVAYEDMCRMKENLEKDYKEECLTSWTFKRKLLNKWSIMKKPTFWKPFILLVFLVTITGQWVGAPFISMYMVSIFEELNMPLDGYATASLIAVLRLTCSTIALTYFDRLNRRTLMLTCGSIVGLGNGIIAFYLYFKNSEIFLNLVSEDIRSYIPLIGLIISYGGSSMGHSQITYCYQGEVLPAQFRVFGGGIILTIDALFFFIMTKSAPYIWSSLGLDNLFALFTVTVVIQLTVLYFFMKETKGYSLEEIENFYVKKTEDNKIKA